MTLNILENLVKRSDVRLLVGVRLSLELSQKYTFWRLKFMLHNFVEDD